MKTNPTNYRGHRFPPEIISHSVWLYHRFCLSFRDVEELLAKRGIPVQQYRNARAAKRFFRKLLTGQGSSPALSHLTLLTGPSRTRRASCPHA